MCSRISTPTAARAPNQFLPAAERNGMMRKIDRWVPAAP
jgi:EAL domain-containing protein (putative c-di-GMP-specific phosphodiesterase class I)